MEAYSKKLLLLISIALLFSACADMEVTIKGYNRINVDTNYTYVAAIENDDEKLVIKNYYASGPAGADTPWNIYTDPIVNLAKSFLL